MMTQEQWKAIAAKDSAADGKFWYALRNGRTFCRPSCPSKTPSADRVLVFDSCEEALQAGYRPCRICRPDQMTWRGAKADLTEQAKTYMARHMHEKFSLQRMAEALHVDGSYLLRTFHHETGCTPLWYHQNLRCEEACQLLSSQEHAVGEISAMLGFSTPALFSRVFKKMRGVSPSAYREHVIRSYYAEDSEEIRERPQNEETSKRTESRKTMDGEDIPESGKRFLEVKESGVN